MIRTKANYHVSLKKPSAVKIAAALVFAMFLNMLNLGAFASMSDSIRASSSVLKLENELGRIYSVVNLPINIVNDMFKKDKEMSDSSKDKSSKDNKLFALLVPAKQTKKSGSALHPAALAPAAGSGKMFLKSSFTVLYDTPLKYCCMILYLTDIDAVRCMLLLLMIMLLLPRGIPVKITNLLNIKFVFPVFVLKQIREFLFFNEMERNIR